MKKELRAVGCILASVIFFTGCGIKNQLKKYKKDTSNVAAESNIDVVQNVDMNGSSLGGKELEGEYSLKRKSLDSVRDTENSKELKEFEDNINLSANLIKKAYDAKIAAANNAMKTKIKKELDIELQRVKAEFQNAKNKIEAEYAAEKSKNMPYAENNRKVKLLQAEKENAEKERVVRDRYAAKIEAESKSYENKKNALNNLWNEYDRKMKQAQQERDNNKTAFKNKTIKEYDEKMTKLSEDNIATESIWDNTVMNEDKVIREFYKKEDEKYKIAVRDIINWRDDELSKIK
ncbi:MULTISPECIES: hypothetical protein [Clostridium]|uniref:Uncharacterized protein n=2 Tax=Clostridium TaxID=1485 RepID=A0A151AKC2_9CLOT|nr:MULTISPECIES: hypothetical protein [Clostridium]KYH27980.1 hypothetical protein CLCOL_23890 [Clostridium colicanis DSM 13634]MBE6045065.1 hypothetical protein [Clostridium thermopalmarium]PRR71618.1 hypothetical protein CPAL_16830 [Clostridium thermopalmarium DSM 5974]PVZ19403.1 hypothetical protein LX19_02651 [Clostridium thermopalmarium DSM 5974]